MAMAPPLASSSGSNRVSYASYNSGIGAKIRAGETTLEELAAYAENMGAPALPGSGRQEYLEAVVNNILFFG